MYTDTQVIAAFNAEAGDVATLATDANKLLWFNQGQARLPIRRVIRDTITWTAGDVDADLPVDYYSLRRLDYHPDNADRDRFTVLGTAATVASIVGDGDDLFNGAQADGSAVITYEAEWPEVTASIDSVLPRKADVACVYYALHRFYRLLGSNRAFYKRYSTLTGANAVSMSDLQGEADRYLQDYNDSAGDLTLGTPVSFYGG